MGRVSGKVAVVTGAASGIGRATAELLGSEGAFVLVTDIDVDGAASVATAIKSRGGEADSNGLDVTSEQSWSQAIEALLARQGKLDVMVNNAGIVVNKPILKTTLEEWRRVISVNLDGVFLGTRFSIDAMGKRGGGSIVNVSSVYGLVGAPGAGAYSASKGGVRLLTKTAALECAAFQNGVRVNSVHPGFVETAMIDEVIEKSADPESTRSSIEGMHPLKRMAKPGEVAAAVLFLASDESSFVTGSELVVDGGFTAR